MKESKAVYVTKHKIRDDQNLVYQIYAKHREYSRYYDTNNFGCQYNSRKDNLLCTCRNPKRQEMRYFSGSPKQIYAYHGSRSYTDIGVGSVKTLQKRKVKRVYLPETDDRGVGSSDLSSFIFRKIKKQKNSFYDHKRTSSKCIGAFQKYHSFISQRLSPIVQTRSGSTSPKTSHDQRSIEIGSNTINKNVTTTGTQFENEKKEHVEINNVTAATDKETSKKPVAKVSEHKQTYKCSNENHGKKISVIEKKIKEVDKVFSSDSLVQHVHNLDNPSDEKQSRTSIDPMENKLEREYRRLFTTKDRESKSSIDKPIPEFKSASLLRRRFEALRRGLKKDDAKKINLTSSQDSVPSRKDASVTSDPPSLEGRSFTHAEKYSPMQIYTKDKVHYKTERNSAQWPQSDNDSECQGVKGMFNLWGKKFKFEEEAEKAKPSATIEINKKPNKQTKPKKEVETKKSGRKFFFFKKKSKDQKLDKPKEKEIYNPSGVTAGRCEIGDGLVMKMGTITPKEKVSRISEEGEEIQRKTWFKNFLSSAITSARSVNVRWNNSMYATSSSTVFELMDTIYKNNGVVLKSRSEITSDESSYYRSYTKNKVNFDQNIEAWMIPNTIPDRPREIPVRIQSNREIKERDIDITISDQRWFIEKSKAFANKIEVVLLSKNFNRVNKKVSSEYLRIDIPKDFFDISSSDYSKQNHTSDEEVYKIVEYESDINTKKALEKGDHASEIKVIVSVQDSSNQEAKILETVIKRPPTHRDVVIQGSNVNIPKRCDVIGVGIITQRDLRDIKKPILKIQNDLTDEDSEETLQTNQKKCEFAESYLQEYYRHWTPLGIDLFSWCVSDSHLRSCSEKSINSFSHPGDGSKSCPNIFEDFQTSAIISSCNTSSCSQCYEDPQKADDSISNKFFKKMLYKKPYKAKTETDLATSFQRVLPKDSLEVFKRRKIYAASLKSQWAGQYREDKPVSVPSIESKGAQDTLTECPKMDKPICKSPKQNIEKKPCKKHVSMLDSDTMNEILAEKLSGKKPDGILAFKGQSGCDACKKKDNKCPKHTIVKAKPICEIPPPPCKDECEKQKKPPCSKPGSATKISHKTPSPKKSCSAMEPKLVIKINSNGLPVFTHSCEQCKPNCPAEKCPGSVPVSPPACPTTPPPVCPPLSSKQGCPPAPIPKSPAATPPKCPGPSPPKCPSTPSPPCPTSPPLSSPPKSECPPSCPWSPKKSRARRKAKPDIRCGSPPGSPKESPLPSHNCLSPVGSFVKPKRCPQCQGPQPCEQFPLCKLSSESIKKLPDFSPKSSPKATPPKSGLKMAATKSPKPSKKECSPKPSPKECTPKPCPKECTPKPSPKESPAKPSPKESPSKPCPEECSPKPSPKSPPKPSPKESPAKLSPKGSPPKASPKTSPPSRPTSPKKSPPRSPKKKRKGNSKKNSPNRPVCDNSKKSSPPETPPKSPCCSDIFPWPINNQVSNPPSPSNSETDQQNKANSKNKCPLLAKSSNKSLVQKQTKECKADCANRPKSENEQPPQVCPENNMQPCPTKHQQPCPAKSPTKKNYIEMSKAKISGLFLKMKPSKKKSCSKECIAWENQGNSGVLRLNSREKITISMKKDTPSTEEIRECVNLKVRDDDGNTLFERKDYTCGNSGHRPSVLGDVYKEPKVNRVSTPVMLVKSEVAEKSTEQEDNKYKSEASLSNLIEIQFKLRITQGDKTTEICIANEDEKKLDKANEICNTQPEVFVVENEGKQQEKCIEESPKNDINIKIVVKNYKPKSNRLKSANNQDNEYTKKITDKFHTVSTGYSDVVTDPEDDHVYSVHRATIDLESLEDKTKSLSKLSNEMVSEDLTEPTNYIASFHSLDATEDENNDNSVSIKKDTISDKYNYTNDDKDLESDKDALDSMTSNECFEDKYNASEEKKELLKKVFEKAYTQPKTKETVRELTNTLKILLTDSSDNDEVNATSNELARDITYASLKPDFFRNTDSMNNYYKIESNLTVEGSKIASTNLFPTEENNSTTSGTSRSGKQYGCMCKRVAEKLNCDLKIGCCCRQRKVDEITSCDIKEDTLLLNYRADYVDVFTQNSKHLSNKSNSMNLSIYSNDNSVQIETDRVSITDNSMNTSYKKIDNLQELGKIFAPHKNLKECEIKRLNRATVLGISDDDKVVLLTDDTNTLLNDSNEHTLGTIFKASDILQSYETKKAVLEIYAEKTLSDGGEHFVAKLPKFVYEKESEITRNYEQIATNSYKSVCKRNVFRMSVG